MKLRTDKLLIESILLLVAVTLLGTGCGTAAAHEGHAHAQEATATPTASPTNRTQGARSRVLDLQQQRADRQRAKRDAEINVEQQRLKAINDRERRLSERLAAIQDEKKREKAEQLSDRLNHVNSVHATNYLRFLERMDIVLGKFEDRAIKAEAEGLDITAFLAKVTALQTEIDTLRTKVEAQKAKIYEVEITTEDKLREAFQATLKQMIADHKALRDELKQQPPKLRTVLQELKNIKKTRASASPTTSPAASPTAASEE